MDAFDRYWEWAKKPVESRLILDGRLHNPIMALSKEDRKDRQKVNDAVERYVWPGDENGFRLDFTIPPTPGRPPRP